MSGTPQSTRRFRSSQTLPLGSGRDTCPRSPAHEERREESGSRNNIGPQPGRPVISPEIQQSLHTEHTNMHKYTVHEYTHALTLSVHMSTHLSTDMFWMTELKGSARVTLSGLRKHPLKMALPSETDRTKMFFTNRKKEPQYTPAVWLLSSGCQDVSCADVHMKRSTDC